MPGNKCACKANNLSSKLLEELFVCGGCGTCKEFRGGRLLVVDGWDVGTRLGELGILIDSFVGELGTFLVVIGETRALLIKEFCGVGEERGDCFGDGITNSLVVEPSFNHSFTLFILISLIVFG